MVDALFDINEYVQVIEKEKKAERKRRRQDAWPVCEEDGCAFGSQTGTGLVNHVHQRIIGEWQK